MLWETSQQLTNLPPLAPDARRLIAAFLNVDQDINELANELSEDFFDIVQKLCDPTIKIWITAINALKNNERRERALHALDITLTSERNPNIIRRAATRILRHLELSKPTRAIEVCGPPHTSMQTTPNSPPQTPTDNQNHSSISSYQVESAQQHPTHSTCHRLPKAVGADPKIVVGHSTLNTNQLHESVSQPKREATLPPTPELSESSSEGPGQTTECLQITNNTPSPTSPSKTHSASNVPFRQPPLEQKPVPLSAFYAHFASTSDFAASAHPPATHPTTFPADNSAWPSLLRTHPSHPPAPPSGGSAS